MSQPNDGAVAGGMRWKVAGWSAAAMVVLALIGVGLATARAETARNYWVALVPVYGVLCTVTAWKDARGGDHPVLRQVLHWLAIAGAVALDFAIRGSGVETSLATGLDALLLLAVGCVLAGVHLDWLFVPVGLLLTLTLILVSKAEQYLWLLLVGAVFVAAAAFFAWRRFGAASDRHSAPTSIP